MPISTDKLKIKPAFKLWFEVNRKYIFGEGTCRLLEKVNEKGSLSAAAKALGMSYRYAWGLIKNVESHLEKPMVKTQRGGRHGGKTQLTETGLYFVESYKRLKKIMADACSLE